MAIVLLFAARYLLPKIVYDIMAALFCVCLFAMGGYNIKNKQWTWKEGLTSAFYVAIAVYLMLSQ